MRGVPVALRLSWGCLTAPDETDLYTRLLAANAEAMEAGLYQAAFHALVSALHAVEALPNPDRYEAVAAIAERQQRHIDEREPGHRLSTSSSHGRGHVGLFPTLALQARVKARLALRPRA